MIGRSNDDAIKVELASILNNLLPLNSARGIWKLLAGMLEIGAINITQRHDLLVAHFLNVVPRPVCGADARKAQLVWAPRSDGFEKRRCCPRRDAACQGGCKRQAGRGQQELSTSRHEYHGTCP